MARSSTHRTVGICLMAASTILATVAGYLWQHGYRTQIDPTLALTAALALLMWGAALVWNIQGPVYLAKSAEELSYFRYFVADHTDTLLDETVLTRSIDDAIRYLKDQIDHEIEPTDPRTLDCGVIPLTVRSLTPRLVVLERENEKAYRWSTTARDNAAELAGML